MDFQYRIDTGRNFIRTRERECRTYTPFVELQVTTET